MLQMWIRDSMIDIITPISYDHQEYLGNTLKQITNEKLGIIKKSSSIIVGKQKNEILNYISKKIKKYKNKKIIFGRDYKISNIRSKNFSIILKKRSLNFNKPLLLGKHQIENAALAIIASYEIINNNYKLKKYLINKALIKTFWPGRLEKFKIKNLTFLLDGAHNVAGAQQMANFLSIDNKNTWLIIGMLNNKNLFLFLKTLKKYIDGAIAINIPGEKNSFYSGRNFECL